MVEAADEFDRSFLHLKPNTAVISTIDADHLEIYGDLQGVQRGFECFVRRIEPDGHLILGPEVAIPSLCNPALSRSTYGLSPSDWTLSKAQWDGDAFTYDFEAGGTSYNGKLPLGGIHNVKNALASIAVAQQHNISVERAMDALASFPGVKRRFQDYWRGRLDLILMIMRTIQVRFLPLFKDCEAWKLTQ